MNNQLGIKARNSIAFILALTIVLGIALIFGVGGIANTAANTGYGDGGGYVGIAPLGGAIVSREMVGYRIDLNEVIPISESPFQTNNPNVITGTVDFMPGFTLNRWSAFITVNPQAHFEVFEILNYYSSINRWNGSLVGHYTATLDIPNALQHYDGNFVTGAGLYAEFATIRIETEDIDLNKDRNNSRAIVGRYENYIQYFLLYSTINDIRRVIESEALGEISFVIDGAHIAPLRLTMPVGEGLRFFVECCADSVAWLPCDCNYNIIRIYCDCGTYGCEDYKDYYVFYTCWIEAGGYASIPIVPEFGLTIPDTYSVYVRVYQGFPDGHANWGDLDEYVWLELLPPSIDDALHEPFGLVHRGYFIAEFTLYPNPEINKSADRSLAMVDDTIRYTITVYNPNDFALEDYVVVDVLDSRVEFVDYSLRVYINNALVNYPVYTAYTYDGEIRVYLDIPPNASVRITFSAIVLEYCSESNDPVVSGDEIINIAVIYGPPIDNGIGEDRGPPVNESEEVEVKVFEEPTVTKTANPYNYVMVGNEIEYTLTVKNPNHFVLENFLVVDRLDTDLVEFVDGSLEVRIDGVLQTGFDDYTTYDGEIRVYLDLPADNVPVVITFRVRVLVSAPIGTEIENIAVVYGPPVGGENGDNGNGDEREEVNTSDPEIVIVYVLPTISKVADPTIVLPGGEIEYRLIIHNPNRYPYAERELKDFEVVDQLNLDLVALVPNSLQVQMIDANDNLVANPYYTDLTDVYNGVIRVTLDRILYTHDVVITFRVSVLDNVPYGTPIPNIARIYGPPPTDENGNITGEREKVGDDTATVSVGFPPNLQITKSADAYNNRVYVADPIGDTPPIVYTITVTNPFGTEVGPANNVVIQEQRPGTWSNPRLIRHGSEETITYGDYFTTNDADRRVTIEILNPGDVFKIDFTVVVTAEMIGEFINNVTVRNATTPEGEYCDDDSVTVTIIPPTETTPTPILQINKTGPTTPVQVGSTITYYIAVTNTSTDVTATNIVIRETQAGTWGTAWLNGYIVTEGFVLNSFEVHIYTLAPGETFTIQFRVLTTQAMVGQHRNDVFVISSNTPEGEEHCDDDYHIVPVVPPNNNNNNNNGGNGGGGDVILYDPIIPLVPFTSTHYRYLIGDNYGRIRPQSQITRAEVATIFFRLITDEFRVEMWTQSNPFPDVALNNWFNNGISTMANANVLRGMPDGSFQPNRSITRGEFAAIISRFVGNTHNGPDAFPDTNGHWAQGYINLVQSLGWVQGMPNGTFEPNRPITRAEAATIVNRILERHPEVLSDLLPGRTSWPDMTNSGAWYYLALQEATNSHSYELKDDNFHETWIDLIPCPNWVALERPHSTPMAHRNNMGS